LTYEIELADETDFAGWRDAARALAQADIAPERVRWVVKGTSADDLFQPAGTLLPEATGHHPLTVPREFRGETRNGDPSPRSRTVRIPLPPAAEGHP
jgi:hypothetical protein